MAEAWWRLLPVFFVQLFFSSCGFFLPSIALFFADAMGHVVSRVSHEFLLGDAHDLVPENEKALMRCNSLPPLQSTFSAREMIGGIASHDR